MNTLCDGVMEKRYAFWFDLASSCVYRYRFFFLLFLFFVLHTLKLRERYRNKLPSQVFFSDTRAHPIPIQEGKFKYFL